MIEELWQVRSKFTPEAHQATLSKCAELEFDQDAGAVSLNESYNNLIWCKDYFAKWAKEICENEWNKGL